MLVACVAGLFAAGPPPVAAAPGASPAACSLRDPFRGMAEELARRYPGRRYSAMVSDGDCTYSLNPQLRITTASVMKLEIMAGVLLRAQRQGRGLTKSEHDQIWPMITQSANPPATSLFNSLGGASGLEAIDNEFGMPDTVHPGATWGLTSTSVADQIHLIRAVVPGHFGPLDPGSRATARGFLTNVIPSQRWGASDGVPAGWVVNQKNGFASSQCCRWRINTVGWTERPDGGGWAIAVLSDGWGTEAEGVAAMNGVAARINRTITAAPFGHVDSVVGASDHAHVTGWTADASDTAALDVHVYVDGAFAGAARADRARPDVGAALPGYGEGRGFETDVPMSAGTHRVCTYGLNLGPAAPNSLLACASVTV